MTEEQIIEKWDRKFARDAGMSYEDYLIRKKALVAQSERLNNEREKALEEWRIRYLEVRHDSEEKEKHKEKLYELAKKYQFNLECIYIDDNGYIQSALEIDD